MAEANAEQEKLLKAAAELEKEELHIPEVKPHEGGEVPPDEREPESEQPPIEDIPLTEEIGKQQSAIFPEGEDEFGPLKGTKGWNKLNAQRKGMLNKKRREAQVEKDTSIPVLEGSPEETHI
jgi:hypothetical protein